MANKKEFVAAEKPKATSLVALTGDCQANPFHLAYPQPAIVPATTAVSSILNDRYHRHLLRWSWREGG